MFKTFFFVQCLLSLVFQFSLNAAVLDTIWVPVKIYDFHSDRTNPEFEQPDDDAVHKNMVADTLDSDGKPVLGTSPYRNNYIRYWFRYWEAPGGAKGDYTIPDYVYGSFGDSATIVNQPGMHWFRQETAATQSAAIKALKANEGTSAVWGYKKHYLNSPPSSSGDLDDFLEWHANVEYKGTKTVSYDTAFKNDTTTYMLPLVHIGAGKYQYKEDNFYPIDDKLLCKNGNEWNVHDNQYIADNNKWSIDSDPANWGTLNTSTNPWTITNPKNTNLTPPLKVYLDSFLVDGVMTYDTTIVDGGGDTVGATITAQSVDHNYSFTMEMDYKFIKTKGLSFSFTGDDDLWVFINGKKVLDLGGIHTPVTDSFKVDDVPGLVDGKTYSMKIFYAERHSDSSHIKITTNIVPANTQISINLDGSDTIKAGNTTEAFLKVFDDDGEQPITGEVKWGFDTSVNSSSTFQITGNKDSLLAFTPTEAYCKVGMWVQYIYTDKNTGELDTIYDTTYVIVMPGDPDHIVVEADGSMPTDTNNLRNDNPLDTVKIQVEEDYNDSFYAISRDKYGNWIGPLSSVSWSSSSTSLVTASLGSATGQGKATKVALDKFGTAIVTASSGSLTSDDIVVKVTTKLYTITSAKYLDTSSVADGYIDAIEVVLDDDILKKMDSSSTVADMVLDNLKGNISLPDYRKFIGGMDFVKTSSGFVIYVQQDKNQVKPYTGVNSEDKLMVTTTVEFDKIGAMEKDEIQIDDGMAPVIVDAVFNPGDFKVENSFDTLTVLFSEGINIPNSDQPFIFSYMDANNDTIKYYWMTLDLTSGNLHDGDSIFTFIVASKNGKEYPEDGDSIKIKGIGAISDTKSNIQNKETVNTKLKVGDYDHEFTVGVIGPFDPNTNIDPDLADYFNLNEELKGTVISVDIAGPVNTSDTLSWTSDLLIYDAVGNLVSDDSHGKMVVKNDGKTYYVLVWNGKNRNGRNVASGSYYAVLNLYHKGSLQTTRRFMIGVSY